MKKYFDLTGSVAVVTGVSTTGFGYQISKALAQQGANLVLLARSQIGTSRQERPRAGDGIRRKSHRS